MLSPELASQVSARLGTLMTEEVSMLRTALGHLQQERQALEAGDVDTLPVLAARKSEAYGRLAQLGDARSALLARIGIRPSREVIESLFASGPDWAQCARSFRDLITLAQEAHDANVRNGALIRAQMKASKQALAVLMSAAEQASTYGPDGQAHTRTSRRSFGSA
ncbi:flagella synthesis protein FlgN [Methyloversatilis thermotolerans]|uniref:flagella synthesis protein FlgN n=1 Tax=Methyloversatilis thermotolerans TaxID=1346290 RepID=UPI000382A527|nr:flagellar protein FlgN [Methyloversatilis thermotolerans]